MNTEDILEAFIQEAYRAEKKLNRNTDIGRKLDKHIAVKIEGIDFSSWREYSVYKTADYLKRLIPSLPVKVELDGNDTTIELEMSEEEQRKINGTLYGFLRQQNLI